MYGVVVSDLWSRGVHQAAGQNLARTLMETPANHLTPTLFCQVSLSPSLPRVQVRVWGGVVPVTGCICCRECLRPWLVCQYR